MAKSKSFRVAVSGPTIDGRTIEPNWLTEAAASYNPQTYAARVNMEHVRGVTADKPFKALGDVLSLRAEQIDFEVGGKTEKRTALFAEIAPTDDLIAMNRDSQKLYTSIEVNPSFADTKKAYVVGLAVTDTPASLGTERLTFAVKNPGGLQPALQAKDNVFSLGLETTFELAAEAEPAADSSAGMFAAATAFFKKLTAGDTPPVVVPPVTPPAPANDNDARFAAIASGVEAMTAAVTRMGTEIRSDLAKLRTDHDTLKASIEATDNSQQRRSLSTGATGASALADF